MLTNEEFEGSARAGSPWVAERDVPDPVGWADFRHSSDTAAQAWRRRREAGVVVGRVHPFVIPKSLDDNRVISVVDPLDELAYRAAVGRVLVPVEQSLGSEVKSYRMSELPPAWRLHDYRYGITGRRNQLAWHLDGPEFDGVVTLDIKEYYPSIVALGLGRSLVGCGADARDATSIAELLVDWNDVWGVRGLPIGPEASGVLGNVPLIPVDRLLRSLGIDFTRYTDDYWIHLHRGADSAMLIDLVTREVDALGLRLNDLKTKVLQTDDAVDVLYDSELADLVVLLADNRGRGLDRVLELFLAAAESGDSNATRLRFCLRVLTSARDDSPLTVAMANERIMRVDPRGWGRYFRALVATRHMDMDWLIELALREPGPDMAAVQLHAFLALRTTSLPSSLSPRLREFVCATGSWVPLRSAASDAWARTDKVTAAQVGDAAIEMGDPYQRRAVTLSLRRWGPSKGRDTRLEKLERVAPDVRPSVAWIMAGKGLDVGLRAA